MIYYLDCEFNEFGGELISLALVGEAGHELYVATRCESPGDWVAQNVIPIIHADGAHPINVHPQDFCRYIAYFLRHDPHPKIVVDWPDDISYFCKALIVEPGQMVNIPALTFELRRVDAYPTTLPGAVQHNALWDARALRHHCLNAPPLGGDDDGEKIDG